LQDETGERKLGRILAHIMKKNEKFEPLLSFRGTRNLDTKY
jgi:hypothetical protein